MVKISTNEVTDTKRSTISWDLSTSSVSPSICWYNAALKKGRSHYCAHLEVQRYNQNQILVTSKNIKNSIIIADDSQYAKSKHKANDHNKNTLLDMNRHHFLMIRSSNCKTI